MGRIMIKKEMETGKEIGRERRRQRERSREGYRKINIKRDTKAR